jgi:ribonuclease P protein component
MVPFHFLHISTAAEQQRGHEENFPAERSATPEDARLPLAHEDEQRTTRPQAPPRQGEKKAHRLIRAGRDERFGSQDRLRRKAEFDAAYASGTRVPSTSFTLIVRPGATERARLGVTIPRATGNAVIRNKIRRRIREIFRHHREDVGGAFDIVVHIRPPAAGTPFTRLEAELIEALRRHRARQGKRG